MQHPRPAFPRILQIALLLAFVPLSACTYFDDDDDDTLTSPAGATPTNLDYGVDALVLLRGEAITPLTPTVQGPVDTWSVSPSLPAGMGFNASNGTLYGRPTELLHLTTFTISAAAGGGTASFQLPLAVEAPTRFLMAAHAGDQSLVTYAVESHTGRMVVQSVSGNLSSSPQRLLAHPSLSLVYVSTSGSGTDALDVYSLDPVSGRALPLISLALESGPHHMTFAANGAWLYVSSEDAGSLTTFQIDAQSGIPNQIGMPLDLGEAAGPLVIHPGGNLAWVSLLDSGALQPLSLDPATGLADVTQPALPLNGSVVSDLVISSEGSHLFATSVNFGFLMSLALEASSGALELIDIKPTSAGPVDISLHPRSTLVYITCRDTGVIETWAYDPLSGLLATSASQQAVDGEPAQFLLDPSGLLGFTASSATGMLQSFEVGALDGVLSPRKNVRARLMPSALAATAGLQPVTWKAEQLYVVNRTDETLVSFSVASDGALSTAAAPVALDADPLEIAVDPFRRFAFVANQLSDTVSVVPLDASGAPAGAITNVPVADEPTALDVDPSGSLLLVACRGTGLVYSYSIDGTFGSLAFIDSRPGSNDPSDLQIDPTGRWVLLTNANAGQLHSLTLDLDGELGPRQTTLAPGSPQQLAFSPDGGTVFTSLRFSNLFVPYQLNHANGELTPILPGVMTAEEPNALAIHPRGHRAFGALLAAGGDGEVVSFDLNPGTMALSQTSSQSSGLRPRNLALTPGAETLYVIHEGGDDLAVLDVAPSGALSLRNVIPTGDRPWSLALTQSLE